MLVIARKPGESIIIDDDIKITFIRVNGDCARFGVDAPMEIRIRREEEAVQDKK